MNPILSSRAFEISKCYDDIIFESSVWISDLNFLKAELLFFKTMIKSNGFESSILKILETLQIFLNEGDNFYEQNQNLIDKVQKYKCKVAVTVRCSYFSLDDNYLELYQKLAKEIFEFNQKYKNYKTNLYAVLIEIRLLNRSMQLKCL